MAGFLTRLLDRLLGRRRPTESPRGTRRRRRVAGDRSTGAAAQPTPDAEASPSLAAPVAVEEPPSREVLPAIEPRPVDPSPPPVDPAPSDNPFAVDATPLTDPVEPDSDAPAPFEPSSFDPGPLDPGSDAVTVSDDEDDWSLDQTVDLSAAAAARAIARPAPNAASGDSSARSPAVSTQPMLEAVGADAAQHRAPPVGRPASLQAMLLHPQAAEAVTIGESNLVTRWRLEGTTAVPVAERRVDMDLRCLCAPLDGALFTTAAAMAPDLQIWRWLDLEPYESIPLKFRCGWELGPGAFSVDGQLFAVRGGDDTVVVVERGSVEVVATLAAGERTGDIAFSPDSSLLLFSVGFDGGAALAAYRVSSGGRLVPAWERDLSLELAGGQTQIAAQIRITPRGDLIAVRDGRASVDGTPQGGGRLSLLRLEDGAVLWQVELSDGAGVPSLRPVFYGPEPRLLCPLRDDLVVLDLAEGRRLDRIPVGRVAAGVDPIAADLARDHVLWIGYADGTLRGVRLG